MDSNCSNVQVASLLTLEAKRPDFIYWCRFCCECVMSSLPTGLQGPCSICGSALTASQLVTYPPKQTQSTCLVPLLDPAATASPTTSTDSEEAGDALKGIHMTSKLKILLADLAKVREEHDGAKVVLLLPVMETLNNLFNSRPSKRETLFKAWD